MGEKCLQINILIRIFIVIPLFVIAGNNHVSCWCILPLVDNVEGKKLLKTLKSMPGVIEGNKIIF